MHLVVNRFAATPFACWCQAPAGLERTILALWGSLQSDCGQQAFELQHAMAIALRCLIRQHGTPPCGRTTPRAERSYCGNAFPDGMLKNDRCASESHPSRKPDISLIQPQKVPLRRFG